MEDIFMTRNLLTLLIQGAYVHDLVNLSFFGQRVDRYFSIGNGNRTRI